MQGKWELLRFSLLGSGSSGNATLLISQQAKILIDCGFSFVQLQRRVAQVGETLSDLKAVFVTHEHGDHVNGLGVLSRKLGVPVYMTEGTRDALSPRLGAIAPICCFEAGETIVLDDIQVNSFSISHDAADPVSYTVTSAGAKIGFCHRLRPSFTTGAFAVGAFSCIDSGSQLLSRHVAQGAIPPKNTTADTQSHGPPFESGNGFSTQ